MERADRAALFALAITALFASGWGASGASAQTQQRSAPAEDADSRALKSAVRTGSIDEAVVLLEQSAKAGDAEAQYKLASLYRSGRGVERDDATAFFWMKEAAGRGHARAQYALGQMYLAGRGTKSDREQAEVWLQQAASQGNEKAAELLQKLATTAEQTTPNATWAADVTKDPPKQTGPKLVLNLSSGKPAILEAAVRGQFDTVQGLIGNGADVQVQDEDGNTALSLAAVAGSVQVVELLISAGADVDTRNKKQETPLLLAVDKGRVDAAIRLIALGADVNARNDHNETPLSLAVERCQI